MLALLITTCGCAQLPRWHEEASTQLLVVRRGWHIDVGFATANLDAPLSVVAARFDEPRYVFFGFGDERYIRSRSHHLPALLAALWPGRGVMLVTALDNEPPQAFGSASVVQIAVSSRSSKEVQNFIWHSFNASGGETAAATTPGPYEGSLYFAAVPHYSAAHTCNTWAAESLRSGGLAVHTTGVVLASQLWRQVQALAREREHPARD